MISLRMLYCVLVLLCWKEGHCTFNRKLKDIHHPLLFTHNNHSHQEKQLQDDLASSTRETASTRTENAFSTLTKTSKSGKLNKMKTRPSNELNTEKTSSSSTTPSAKLKKFNKIKTNELDITGVTKKPDFMVSCKRICKCVRTTSPKDHPTKQAARMITDYLIDCSSIKDFQEVGKLTVPKGKIIKSIVRDGNAQIINGTCITSDTGANNNNDKNMESELCFPSDVEFPLFKRIRVLQLQDLPRLTDLGNQQSDFFSILPNVRSLSINTNTAATRFKNHRRRYAVKIFFSNTAQNLKDLKIKLSTNETMKLSCRSKSCFPTSLNSLTVKYSTASRLNLMNTSMSLPKVIKNVSITIDSQEDKQTASSLGKSSDILSNAKIKNLQLRLSGNGEFGVSLKNTRVLKSFQLTMSPTQVVNGITYYYHYKQLYEIFDNTPLKKLVNVTLLGSGSTSSNHQVTLPVMISSAASSQLRTHFRKSFFDTCHLAKRVLSNANETVIDSDRRKIFVRGFVYDLFDTLELFKTFDEVVVTTYHTTISKTFKVPRNKILRIRYFKIEPNGAGGNKEVGIQSINVNPPQSSKKFTFQSLNVRTDLVKYSSNSDPVFMRALSLCVIQNIGAFMKRKAGSKSTFHLDKKDFWLVGTSFPANLTFEEDFAIEDRALAWQSLSNMNRYLQTVVQTRNSMKTMSKATLRNIDNGRYFFQRYGQKILDNYEDKALMMTETNGSDRSLLKSEVYDRISKFRWQTLDHVYHGITVYKDRLSHVLDSHTNGRPLLYQLVSMFNKYKTKVDENKEKLNKVSKQSNSFTRAKTITVIINALSLLFEDKRTFEHTIKTLDNDWKPDSVDKIIQNMKAIRKLVLALDSISVTFTKMKSRMESKELKFQKYAENLSKLVKRLISTKLNSGGGGDGGGGGDNRSNKRLHRKLKARLRTLDSLKTEVAYPDQVVKLVLCIEDIIQMGRQLDDSPTHRQVFDKVPEPMSFFNPNEANLLYHKALNVSIDQSLKWNEIKAWLTTTLNSTTVKQMFQTLDVRYPIIDLVETAEDITQEMVSNFGYQMTGIYRFLLFFYFICLFIYFIYLG